MNYSYKRKRATTERAQTPAGKKNNKHLHATIVNDYNIASPIKYGKSVGNSGAILLRAYTKCVGPCKDLCMGSIPFVRAQNNALEPSKNFI